MLTNEQERGQCDELVFTVEAETDVGSTGFSTITIGGFSKGKFLVFIIAAQAISTSGFDTTAKNQTSVTITCDRNTNKFCVAVTKVDDNP